MPVSARRSSVGNRRNSQVNKPYRGDQLQVGKKTGYAVRHVQPESDGFEPFDDLIGQADNYTPPHVKNKRKKRAPPTPFREEYPDDDDDFGEQSMDVDSPVKYMNHAGRISAPLSTPRLGSAQRPIRRSSAIDFDELPSPRTNITARTSIASARSSRLSKSYSMPEHTSHGSFNDDLGGVNGDEPPSTPTRSYAGMNNNDDIDDVPEFNIPEPSSPPQTPVKKGKERAPPPPEEDGVEEEIAQELQAMSENGMGGDMDIDNEQEHSPPPRPEKPKPKPKKPREKPKVVHMASDDENADADGLRRSKRHRYEPLDWWRCEKVVYGRRQHGLTIVPQIKEIIRIPKEPPKPLSKKKRGMTRAKSKSRAVSEVVSSNPEEGWDDNTPQLGIVQDFNTKQDVERRIGFTAKHFNPKAAAGNEWFFQKIFGDGDFVAAGQLTIPVGKRKPSKATRDNTYIFFVHEGAVNVKVHNQSMIFSTGAMFMVPRGNTYFIENIAQREAILVFTQARKIPEGEDYTSEAEERHSRRRSTSGRASAPQVESEEEQGEEEEEEEEPKPQPKKKKKTGR